jgi:membrane-bound lytic murein transglycosylase A
LTRRVVLRSLAAGAIAALAACAAQHGTVPARAPTPPVMAAPPAPTGPVAAAATLKFTPVRFSELASWSQSDPRQALNAFRRSCVVILGEPADTPMGVSGYAGTAGDWWNICQRAFGTDAASAEAARQYFVDEFVPVRLSQAGADGFLTGYFEPELHGSRTRHDQYQTPIYGVPPDLVNIDGAIYRDTAASDSFAMRMMLSIVMGRYVPYPARAEIERGGIPATPLFYVDDPIAAFFMEIQGSGRVVLDDGSVVRAAYAGQNGQPYTAIGSVLLERGELTSEEVSLQTIRAWLIAHPEQAPEVMDENESYIFFSEQPIGDPQEGANGAEGVSLTPGASLAVDPQFHPYGVPVWLEGTAPDPDPAQPDRMFDQLLIAQDTGGAIRGPLRGDVYWGFGQDAAAVAGRMKNPARMTVLLPKAVAARLPEHGEIPLS